jgi:phosphate transport system substrate-binding protein
VRSADGVEGRTNALDFAPLWANGTSLVSIAERPGADVRPARLSHNCHIRALSLPPSKRTSEAETMRRSAFSALILAVAMILGCKSNQVRVTASGSSTVYPITEAVAEEISKVRKDVQVTVGIAGTGGGFKKLCAGETDLCDASRPIKQVEVDQCAVKGIDYLELPVAFDGIAVVVNPANDWANDITVAELKKLWEPDAQGKVKLWSDVRAGWPAKEIHLFGPGVDSGTYDYFTTAVVGKEHSSRGDYTASEDDNVLVHGVASDPLAMGFFGLSYFSENQSRLKALGVDDGNPVNGVGPVKPSVETVRQGSYQPLSRPIFLYVARSSLARPEVTAFVEFYLQNAERLVSRAGYVPLPEQIYAQVRGRFAQRTPGSIFGGHGSQVGLSAEALIGGAAALTPAPTPAIVPVPTPATAPAAAPAAQPAAAPAQGAQAQ